MPEGAGPNLVLLADDWTFAELERSGALPRGHVSEASLSHQPYLHEDTGGRIVRVDPTAFTPRGANGQGTAYSQNERERFEELFAGLQGNVLCHVAVLDSLADPGTEGYEGKHPPRRLRELKEWYEQFEASARRHVGAKHMHGYVHILVLVVCDPIGPEEKEDFLYFAQSGKRTGLISRTYVMLRKLEIGRNRALHARYVWPFYLARLMSLFQMTLPELRHVVSQESEKYSARVWRFFEYVPEPPPNGFLDELQAAYTLAYDTLLASADKERGAIRPRLRLSSSLAAVDGLVDQHRRLELEPVVPGANEGQWNDFEAEYTFQHAANPGRWRPRMAEKARESLLDLGIAQLQTSPGNTGDPSETAVQRGPRRRNTDVNRNGIQEVWSKIHEHPKHAFARVEVVTPSGSSESESKSGETNGEEESLTTRSCRLAGERWQKVREVEEEFARYLEELHSNGRQFDKARTANVGLQWRLVLGIVGAVPVALFAFHLTRATLMLSAAVSSGRPPGYFWGPAFVALAGAVGSVCAAVLPWWLHKRRGEQARRKLVAALGSIDLQAEACHVEALRLLKSGADSWLNMRTEGVAGRLRALLRRLGTMLNRELFPGHVMVSIRESIEEDEIPLDDDDAESLYRESTEEERDSRQRRQRRVLRGRTRIPIPRTFMATQDLAMEPIEKAIAKEAGNFLFKWREEVGQWDRDAYGRIPARKLVPMLRDYRERLEEFFYSEAGAQRIQSLQGHELIGWLRQSVSEIELQHFSYFMSCVVPQGSKFYGVFYLQPEWYDRVHSELGVDISIRKFPDNMRKDLFGLIFEEGIAEFDLSEGEEGDREIVVKKVEKN